MVEDRLIEAASVLRRLPPLRVAGYYNIWPQIVGLSSNGQADSTLRLQPPSDGAISCMEEALGWSTWLEPIDSKVVWMRASGRRWKAICWAVGLRRAAAHEHWLFALCVIAWRLNGRRGLPRRVSKRRFIGQVYRASPAPMPTYVLSHLG
jgi:hypothetical protein